MTLGDAFYDLNKRLVDLEISTKQEAFSPPDYYQVMFTVEWNVDYFQAKEVNEKTAFHLSRIKKLIEKIKQEYPNEASNIKRPFAMSLAVGEYHTVNKIPTELFILEELEYYQERLEFMTYLRREYVHVGENKVINEIRLPDNFRLKELHKSFDPALSSTQVILFIHYLRELKFIPDYNYSSLGVLAEPLFGRNRKDIKDGISNYHTHTSSKKDLESIKQVIKKISDAIEVDYREAH